jgi:hypothetical protein
MQKRVGLTKLVVIREVRCRFPTSLELPIVPESCQAVEGLLQILSNQTTVA